MELFIITVQLSANAAEGREIKSIHPCQSDVIFWNVKELDSRFSGEFGWRKIGTAYGIIAIQYINRSLVRMIVKSNDQEGAEKLVEKFSYHLDIKAQHRAPYVRHSSGIKMMKTVNDIATRALLKTNKG